MDKRDWYKGQFPTEAQMDSIFELTEKEIGLVAKDFHGVTGLIGTDVVAHENAAPDNNVLVPAGAAFLERSSTDSTIVSARWGSEQTVDCSVDYLSASTQPGGGKERYLAIFVKYDETLADAWTDYDSNPGYWEHNASFEFVVYQTADANPGTATPVASPGNEFCRVCDILVTNAGWGTIVDPVDPENPGDDEIDYTGVTFLATAEVTEARYGKRTLAEAVENVFAGKIQMGIKRQAIINGNFNIWQRGVTFAAIADATNVYTADRWVAYENLAVGVLNVIRSAAVPTFAESGVESKVSLDAYTNTADTTVAAAEKAIISHLFETIHYKELAGQWCTLSFWVKAHVAGTYCVSFQNDLPGGANDASWVSEFEVSSPDTWEKKEIEVLFDESVGDWSTTYDYDLGMRVNFVLAAGSDFQTSSTDQWVNDDKLATPNQVNLFDNINDNFFLSQVQLNVGRSAMPFLVRPLSEEMLLCQRYYEKSYDQIRAPGYNGEEGSQVSVASGVGGRAFIKFAVQKRDTPTVTVYSSTGASGKVRDITGAADINAASADDGEAGATVEWVATDQHEHKFHWTADCELT